VLAPHGLDGERHGKLEQRVVYWNHSNSSSQVLLSNPASATAVWL
jgi:hypothetical protein